MIPIALVLAACSTPPVDGGGGGSVCNEYLAGTFSITFDGRTYTSSADDSYGSAMAQAGGEVVSVTLDSTQGGAGDRIRFWYSNDGSRVLTVQETIGGATTTYQYDEGSGSGGTVTTDTLTSATGDGFCVGDFIGDGKVTGSVVGTVSPPTTDTPTFDIAVSGVEVVMLTVAP